MLSIQPSSFGGVLRLMFMLVRRGFRKAVAIIAIILGIPVLLGGLILVALAQMNHYMLAFYVIGFFSFLLFTDFVLSPMLTDLAVSIVEEQQHSIWRYIQNSFRKYAWQSLAITLVATLGSGLLLGIPSVLRKIYPLSPLVALLFLVASVLQIYFAIRHSLSTVSAIAEDLPFQQAIERSWQLTKKQAGRVFWRSVLYFIMHGFILWIGFTAAAITFVLVFVPRDYLDRLDKRDASYQQAPVNTFNVDSFIAVNQLEHATTDSAMARAIDTAFRKDSANAAHEDPFSLSRRHEELDSVNPDFIGSRDRQKAIAIATLVSILQKLLQPQLLLPLVLLLLPLAFFHFLFRPCFTVAMYFDVRARYEFWHLDEVQEIAANLSSIEDNDPENRL